jgi:LacI family transcriptional regulator
MKVTIEDIARQAGVSTATVDRVLNDRKGVRLETAHLVREVASRLNYRPDPMAQALSRRENLSFDFLLPAGPNTFLNAMVQHVEEASRAFSKFKVAVRTHRVEGFNPALLSNMVQDVALRSDGIALVALDHPLVREAVGEVMDRGTPVVALVSDLMHTKRIGYVGVDNRMAGRTAGYLLGRFMQQPEGNVALIAGSLSYRGHEEREMGFRNVLQEQFEGLKVALLLEGFDDPEKNYEQACDALRQYPDLKGIYNIGGGARGIGRALVEADKAKQVVFVGHELTPYSRKLLLDGVMDAVINQSGRQEIFGAVQMLLNHHTRQEINSGVEMPKVEIFVRENLP